MVTLVVVINTLISLVLFYVAWQVWQLKQKLACIADSLGAYESCTQITLHKAPENIYLSQQNIYNLRLRNQVLQMQIQQVQQIISLILLGRQIWQRYFRRVRVNTWENNTHKMSQ